MKANHLSAHHRRMDLKRRMQLRILASIFSEQFGWLSAADMTPVNSWYSCLLVRFSVDRSQGRYSNAFRFINIAMAAAQIVRLWRAGIFLHNSVYFWWFFTPGRVGLLETKKMPQRGKTWKISRHRWLKCCCAFDAINFQINKISLIQGKMVSFDPQFVEIQGPVDSNISKRQKWIEI